MASRRYLAHRLAKNAPRTGNVARPFNISLRSRFVFLSDLLFPFFVSLSMANNSYLKGLYLIKRRSNPIISLVGNW